VIPVVALVGRPNVGKSTLFNRLTRSRDALVADVPGLTRDRHYGQGRYGDRRYIVIDTGGFEPVAKEGIAFQMARQTRQAVIEADIVIFICDGRDGVTPHDYSIANELRKARAQVTLVVNKSEGMRREIVTADFHSLGLGEPLAISSAHGDGVRELIDYLIPDEPEPEIVDEDSLDNPPVQWDETSPEEGLIASGDGDDTVDRTDLNDPAEGHSESQDESLVSSGPTKRIKVAIVGRPNVGKSTLSNTLLGEERMIAFDQPGTTRDSVSADFERNGKPYTLIDTAGIRRRGKVTEMIEKFSVVKTLKAIEDCNVAVLLLDAHESVAEQDAHIAGYILEAGCALVIAVNKWDGLGEGEKQQIRTDLERKLMFLKFANLHFISAKMPFGISALMNSIDGAHAAAFRKLPTPKLTRAIQEAVERQTPPRRGQIRPKLRFAHQGGQNPPIIVIHGNALKDIPETYRRYLEGWFRTKFDLQGTPLRIEFRSSTNPFVKDSK
jgi:GTPase